MVTRQILTALCKGSLFLEDLPEGRVFDREGLIVESETPELRLNQKLGHLYEDGLELLLEASERYEVLEKGLQLQRGRHETLGELDYLCRDTQSGDLVHLELAVKFYMAIKSSDELLLPGPNARDNYYNKLERMRNHQLTLTTRFREFLPTKYQVEEVQVRQLVIGCLFDHVKAEELACPPFVHADVRRGLWLRQKEYEGFFPDSSTPLVIPKPLWPVGIESINEGQLESLDLSEPLDRCTLVKVSETNMPVFITPDCYPEQ